MINQDNIVMAISFILVAAFVVFWLLKRAKLRRARSWPSEVGRVESTAVVLRSGGGQPGAAAYYAELKYSYTVQGQTYSGGLSRRFILKGRADKWIGKYTNHQALSIRSHQGERFGPVGARTAGELKMNRVEPNQQSASVLLRQDRLARMFLMIPHWL